MYEREREMDVVGGTVENRLVSGGREGGQSRGTVGTLPTWREVEDMTCTSRGRYL